MSAQGPLITSDGRYLVVRDRLRRRGNPALSETRWQALVADLKSARRDVGRALRASDRDALANGRAAVDLAKIALGERGPVWWVDNAPDLTRRMARNTPYADWYPASGTEG